MMNILAIQIYSHGDRGKYGPLPVVFKFYFSNDRAAGTEKL